MWCAGEEEVGVPSGEDVLRGGAGEVTDGRRRHGGWVRGDPEAE